MNRSRTIISALASLALGSLMASPVLGALSASPNPSSTGSYTVSGSVSTTRTYGWVSLIETAPGGTTADFDVADAGNISEAFSGKSVGTYTYRVQGCRYDLDEGNPGSQEPIVICEDIGASLSVSVVSPAPADPMPDFGTATVAAKSWTQNSAISSFTVPAATGGDAPLSYTAKGLPTGVSMSSSRSVSGTPGTAGMGTATVTVSDKDGDTDTLSFAWSVAADLTPTFGTSSVSARSWKQNSAITGFTVPAASGGDAPLSYAASGLPAGVSMTSSRRVSGTPSGHGSGTARVTVTDSDGDTATLSFTWAVAEDLAPDFGDATVSYRSWAQNSAITAFTVPAATGGDAPLSYSIGGLPAGLSMSGSRTISGTPTASGVGAATVTVRDADGDTDTLRFSWFVGADRMPTFGTAAIADKTFKQNSAITAFYVPIASGGNWPLSYSATGLPTGVSLASNRRVSGTPTAHGTGTATVTVSDSDGDTDTLEFDWSVNEDLSPSFATASVADKDWTLRTRIAAFTVPAATGGDGTLRYAASGLPSGVWISSSTRRISGSPSGNDASSGTATVTARDADGDTATLEFDWSVEDPMPDFGQAAIPDKTWTHNTAIARFTAPAASGGNTPRRYAASGLPAGVSMSSLRRFSGTPTATGSGTATVTARDADGDTDSIEFDWTVRQGDLMPTFTSRVPAKLWLRQAAVATFTVPAATGGDAPLSYSATGLPAGVTMSSARAVSGTPTAIGSGTATVTVEDDDGDTDTLSFNWTVYDIIDPPPPPAHKKWLKDQPIAGFTVPGASGGVAPLNYSINGLPNGLSMSSSRRVSGTPTATGSGTAIVTVTDANNDTDTVSFTWNVEIDTEPSFGSGTSVSTKAWTPNTAIAAFTIPEATGGNSPVSYAATGLPAGVSLSTATRQVSGTPTRTGTGTATITVTDFDGDTDTLRFAWRVASANRTPSFDGVTVAAKAWAPNRAIAAFTIPAATGGDGTVTYAATGLPGGVSMSALRVVSGTPTAAGTGTATVTARDRDGDTGTLRFTWTVAADLKPAFATATLTNRDWTEGQAVTAFTVPTATGGDGSLTYTATGLPSGVSMASSRSVSGTPGNSGSGTAIVTATDADGDSASTRFAWAVSPGPGDLAPTFGAGTVATQDWILSRTIQSLTVPAASGGDGTLTYSIENLPAGVSMSTARVVSGTPTATGSRTATVTVTDADGDFDTLSFQWTVLASAPILSANPNPSTTGNFTVRWTAFRTNDQDYFLVETAPGGGTKSYTVDINASKQFIAKPDGTHSYQMKGCRAVYDRDTQAQVYRCTDLGNALTVTVDGPEADTVATQLNYTFTAHAGDFDSNGNNDLLIKRTSSGAGAGIFQTVILSQKAMGQFTLLAPSETEVMAASAYPVASNVSLVLGDYNLDGFVDILLRGLSTAVTGALDRIVYAPGGKTGGHPTVLNAVDDDFTKFLTQTTSWIRDNDYFANNAVTVPITSTGITKVYHCEDSETGDLYYTDFPCYYGDTVIDEIEHPFVNVVNVISYGHFNQDALAFSRQFSLVDGRINPNVTLGSQQAKNLSQILMRVFGTQILNGQLEKSCTGFFSYDSQLSIPCNDEYLLGRALMQTATETLNDVDPTTGTNERRALTNNEKTIAQENGLGLTSTELGLIEVVNAGDIIQGSPDAACQVLPSDKYVIQCIDSIYSSMPDDLMLHELAHVAQVAYEWPKSAPADWQFDDNGDVSLDKKYVYRNPTSSNTEQRELLYDEFSDYTWEQQAALLQDRYRACKQNQFEYNSDNKTKDHEDFIRNGRIDTTAHDAYLKKIYDGIDGISGMPADSGSCRWETVRANAPTIH